jgi:16S rRNA (guanine527-N7)-methyltransferase
MSTLQLSDFNLTAAQTEQLERYCSHLLAANAQYNLTAVRSQEAVWSRHFVDSLSLLNVLPESTDLGLIDVGTGAGFPGLVLKIVRPQLVLTLVESVAKKARYCQSVVDLLGLGQVTVLTERAEVLGQDARYREQFDWAVARAVAPMPVLAEYLLPLVKVGGTVLAQKGPAVEAELAVADQAIATLGGQLSQRVQQILPAMGEDQARERMLIAIRKVSPTPDKYPRRPGMPAKRPL